MPGRELTRVAALHTDPRPVIAVGTTLFLLASLVLLLGYHWLGQHHHRDWLWTSVAGALLGITGWLLMGTHRRQGRTG